MLYIAFHFFHVFYASRSFSFILFSGLRFPHGVRPCQLLCWRRPRWFSTSSDLWLFSHFEGYLQISHQLLQHLSRAILAQASWSTTAELITLVVAVALRIVQRPVSMWLLVAVQLRLALADLRIAEADTAVSLLRRRMIG